MKSYYKIENTEGIDSEITRTLSDAKSYVRFGFSESEKSKLFNDKAHAVITHFIESGNTSAIASETPFVYEDGVTHFFKTRLCEIKL